MKQWDYETHFFDTEEPLIKSRLSATVNDLGKEGWELVSTEIIQSRTNEMLMIFKREK